MLSIIVNLSYPDISSTLMIVVVPTLLIIYYPDAETSLDLYYQIF